MIYYDSTLIKGVIIYSTLNRSPEKSKNEEKKFSQKWVRQWPYIMSGFFQNF